MNDKTTDDILQKEHERRQGFWARLAGVAGGIIGGISVGKLLLTQSLRKYVFEKKMEEDPSVIAAYNTVLRKPVSKKIAEASEVLSRRTAALTESYFDKVKKALTAAGITPEHMDAAVNRVKNNNFPSAIESTLSEFGIKNPNQISKATDKLLAELGNKSHFIKQADRQIYQKAIHDEMIKRMGLRLRHADNRNMIILQSIGATVAIGAAIYMGAKWLITPSKDEEKKSFQAQVAEQRGNETQATIARA